MNLDDQAKKAVEELGEAINAAIEKSPRVIEALETLRAIGYEPNLNLRLDVGLLDTKERNKKNKVEEVKLDLTDEDLKTLHRMKIKI
jgi:hypothetical protein